MLSFIASPLSGTQSRLSLQALDLINARQQRGKLVALLGGRMAQCMGRRMHELVGERVREMLDHEARVLPAGEPPQPDVPTSD